MNGITIEAGRLDFVRGLSIYHFMISPSQLRAARALLGLSIDDLSAESGVPSSVIAEIELDNGGEGDSRGLLALSESLARLGVTFIADGDAPSGGEGVRRTERRPDQAEDGLRPEMLNASNDG